MSRRCGLNEGTTIPNSLNLNSFRFASDDKLEATTSKFKLSVREVRFTQSGTGDPDTEFLTNVYRLTLEHFDSFLREQCDSVVWQARLVNID